MGRALDSLRVNHWEDLPPGEWLENDAEGNHWFKDVWGNYWCSDGDSFFNYSKTRPTPQVTPFDKTTHQSDLFSETSQYPFDDHDENYEDKIQSMRREIKIKKALVKKYRRYRILAFFIVFIPVLVGIGMVTDSSSPQDLNCDQYDSWQEYTQKQNCEAAEQQVAAAGSEVAGLIIFTVMVPIGMKYLKWENKYHNKMKEWRIEIKEMINEIKLLRSQD